MLDRHAGFMSETSPSKLEPADEPDDLAEIIAKLLEHGLIIRKGDQWVATETGKAVLERQGVEPS